MFSQNSLVSKFDTNLLGHFMPKVLSSFFFSICLTVIFNRFNSSVTTYPSYILPLVFEKFSVKYSFDCHS